MNPEPNWRPLSQLYGLTRSVPTPPARPGGRYTDQAQMEVESGYLLNEPIPSIAERLGIQEYQVESRLAQVNTDYRDLLGVIDTNRVRLERLKSIARSQSRCRRIDSPEAPAKTLEALKSLREEEKIQMALWEKVLPASGRGGGDPADRELAELLVRELNAVKDRASEPLIPQVSQKDEDDSMASAIGDAMSDVLNPFDRGNREGDGDAGDLDF